MNPIQPFFTLRSDHYYKKIIYRHGISHIYCFTCEELLPGAPSVVPDGCLDVTFDLTASESGGMVCGSVSRSVTEERSGCDGSAAVSGGSGHGDLTVVSNGRGHDGSTVIPNGIRHNGSAAVIDDAAGSCSSHPACQTPHSINQIGHTYLGIRFEPGYMPSFIDGEMADFVDREVPLEECCRDRFLNEKILSARDQLFPRTPGWKEVSEVSREETTFSSGCYREDQLSFSSMSPSLQASVEMLSDLLVNECHNYQTKPVIFPPAAGAADTQLTLALAVQRLISASSGMVQVRELEEETGYSRRYITEVFHAATGFSPKQMCEIVRFQAALDELTHNRTVPIADVAVKYGYYDQPQFCRDIRKYLHATPRSYRSALQNAHYLEKFVMI